MSGRSERPPVMKLAHRFKTWQYCCASGLMPASRMRASTCHAPPGHAHRAQDGKPKPPPHGLWEVWDKMQRVTIFLNKTRK